MTIKGLVKIAQTNWVHLVGFLFATYAGWIIDIILESSKNNPNGFKDFYTGIIEIPIFLLTYGLLPILGFLAVLLLLDTIFFIKNKKYVLALLFVQWLLIVPKFIMWAFDYEYWLWIYLALSFLVTQSIRSKKVKSIISKESKIPKYNHI